MCHPEVSVGSVAPAVRTEEVGIAVEGGSLPALLAFPARTPAPAILVVNDVFGRSPFYENLARRLAQAGFVALDPEFFFREGPVPAGDREAATARRTKLDQQRTLRDLGAALAWLRARKDVQGRRVGTVGFCMGGTLVLDLAAEHADLATVTFYGFPASGGDTPLAPPRPLDLAARMHGPILGFWGGQDAGVGMDNVKALDGKLSQAGVAHEFQVYPGLGHGFLKAFLEDESAAGYRQACAAWTVTLDFYRAQL